MYRGIRLPAMATTVLAVFALSGCGGGSDGGGSPSVKGGRLSPGDEVQDARARAAGATPRRGSVTQSSDVGTTGSITQDVVTVAVDADLGVTVTYNNEEAVSTGHVDAEERKNVEYVLDRPKGTRYFERFDYGDSKAVEFYRSLEEGDLTEMDGSDVPAGDLWVDVYTDFNGDDKNETNYLAGGIWVYIPDDGTADDYEFGAFADGAAPYDVSKINALTSTAECEGGATGVYSYGTNGGRRNVFFDAAATLMANFEDNEIGGKIYNVEVDDEPVQGTPELTLLETPISTTETGGFFSGNTRMEDFEGEDYTGKWGGQFYNDPNTGVVAEDTPGAVAGTFGGANDGGDKSFVGVFGAYHPPTN